MGPSPSKLASGSSSTADNQAQLVRSLCHREGHGRGIERIGLLETHISYVLLTGPYAYKIKKAVDLDFLNFTTLTSRHFYCEEELRLNRRLAPAIYLDVVPITGTIDEPEINGAGPAIEYAVKMRQFDQDSLLTRMLSHGALTAAHIDALASKVAEFHRSIRVARPDGPFGAPADILRLAIQNFTQTPVRAHDESDRTALDALRTWTDREHAARKDLLLQRRRDGFVRECHGDLHLGNVALVDDEITIFDCIEFNDEMRWIDVMSEIAFAVMDLQDRKRSDLAFRFLNAYLEATGDYAGVCVLPFYLAYRAMVRAKIAALRADQLGPDKTDSGLMDEYRGYVKLAAEYARPPRPAIIITHGVAASGKTTLSQTLLEQIGAVRIRTDVERKRLYGFPALAGTSSPVGGGLYTPQVTEQTYQHVCRRTRDVATAGRVAIADGTFLKRRQRDLFRALASELAIPFAIMSCRVQPATLRDRIDRRTRRADDASEADAAVLEHQLETQEPIAEDEQPFTLTCDAQASQDDSRVMTFCREVIERLRLSPSG